MATMPTSTSTTMRNGTATWSQMGARRAASQLRTGDTAITSTSASTTGPAMEDTSRIPKSTTTAAAVPSRMVSDLGRG